MNNSYIGLVIKWLGGEVDDFGGILSGRISGVGSVVQNAKHFAFKAGECQVRVEDIPVDRKVGSPIHSGHVTDFVLVRYGGVACWGEQMRLAQGLPPVFQKGWRLLAAESPALGSSKIAGPIFERASSS